MPSLAAACYCTRVRKAPLLAPPEPPSLTLLWDGAPLAACPRDTVAAALIGAGELATSRSAKYRRLRGPACLHGGCGTCLVRIGGRPNQRACLTPVRQGMVVEPQNTFGGLDPTALVDQLFPRGIDHHHLVVSPRLANQAMQGVARELAGFGELPDAPPADDPRLIDHAPEVMVIGAGRSGRALAHALAAAGRPPLVVERRSLEALAYAGGAPLPADLLAGVGVFACYPHERLWAAASERPPALHRLRPRHVVLAVGAHEPTIPLANNDLPGVVSARGLLDMLEQTGRKLTARVVLIGEGARAELLAAALGAERVDPARVRKLLGARRVKGVQLDDGRHLRCDLVALAPEPAPAFELAAQAGAEIVFTGAGFAPRVDPEGRVATGRAAHPLDGEDAPPVAAPPWTLWAVGELTGATTPAEIQASVDRCAAALLRALDGPAAELRDAPA